MATENALYPIDDDTRAFGAHLYVDGGSAQITLTVIRMRPLDSEGECIDITIECAPPARFINQPKPGEPVDEISPDAAVRPFVRSLCFAVLAVLCASGTPGAPGLDQASVALLLIILLVAGGTMIHGSPFRTQSRRSKTRS
jgi:hypothetical protein